MNLILSIEVGPIASKVGLVNQYGDLQAKLWVNHDPMNFISNLHEKVIVGLETIGINYEDEIEKISIAIAGYIDHTNGFIRYSSNLYLKNYDLQEITERLFKKPVFLINNANASALGEFWVGGAKQYDSIIFYYIDYGIGGAVITDGKLVRGSKVFAGEFGHGGGIIDNVEKCQCGLKGCIEPLSSIGGIENFFTNTFDKNPNHPSKKLFKNPEHIKFKEIVEVYEKNEYPVEIFELLKITLEPIIKHMAILINAIGPEAIVLSGKITDLNDKLIEIVKLALKEYVSEVFLEELDIENATLGKDAAIIGAASYAINDWKIA